MKIAHISVKRPLLVNLLTLAVFILGYMALRALPRDVMPQVDFNYVTIKVLYPGASAVEVEKQVTVLVEDALKGVKGIKRVISFVAEGVSFTFAELKLEKNLNEAHQEISDAIDKITDFPDEVEDIEVNKLEVEVPVIEYAVSGSDMETLRSFSKKLERKIKKVDGVSSVVLVGYRDRQVTVEVDPAVLEKFQVGLLQIVNALKGAALDVPAGSISINQKEYLVRTCGFLQAVDRVGDTVLRTNEDGRPLFLKNVAKIKPGYEEQNVEYRAFGKEAIVLTVYKKPQGDTIKIAKEVKKLVSRIKPPPGARAVVLRDHSFFVKRRLNTVASNAVFGFFLVFVILMILMERRVALMTALGIPFALFATFLLMRMFGVTLNMISLFGLIVVLGMLVDDGIIIAENTYHYLEAGLSPTKAAIKGTDEVVIPVFASVMTTIIAFSPLLFMKGLMGRFVFAIPLVVILALASSLLEAYFVLPSHLAEFAKRPKRIKKEGKVYKTVVGVYQRVLKFFIKHRAIFLSGFVLLLIFTLVFAFKFMKFELIRPSGTSEIEVYVKAPEGVSMDYTRAVVSKVEKAMTPLVGKEAESFISFVGTDEPRVRRFGREADNLAIVVLKLYDEKQRTMTDEQLISYLKNRFRRQKIEKFVSVRKKVRGPKVGKPVDISVGGESFEEILPAVADLERALKKIDGVYDISDDYLKSKREIVIKIDPVKAARLNIDPLSVATILRAIKGIKATVLRFGDENVDIVVRYSSGLLKSIDFVKNLKIANRLGRLVPLKEFASFKYKRTLRSITRMDYERVVTVTAEIDRTKTTSRRVNAFLKRRVIPELKRKYPDITFTFGGEAFYTKEAMADLLQAFIIAAIFIYILLVATFGSLTDPVIIMVTIPFGIIGVIWTLFVHGLPLGFLQLMALVALSGVVVNDAIVLVDFIEKERKAGAGLMDAVVKAGIRRFRPVFLTTVTTAAGLFTTAYGIAGSDPMLKPFAVAFMWGLVFATALTLLFVPVLYYSVENLKIRLFGHR